MKNLILHIGAHKTGTTYIQKVFYDSHKALLEENILYPLRWTQNLWGHHELIQLAKEGRFQQIIDFLDENFKRYGTIILSSENFEDFPQKTIDKLKSALADRYAIKIVYFVRRLTKMLPSQWQENVKHGSYQTFPEYILSHLNAPFNSTLLNYSIKINRWMEAFGKDVFNLVSYDNLVNDNIDIADYFASNILDYKGSLTKKEKKVNTSLNAEVIEVIRVLNYLHYQESNTQSLYPRYYLLKLMELNVIDLEYTILKLKDYRAIVNLADESYIFKQLNNYLFQQFGDYFINIKDDKIFSNTKMEEIYYINSTAIASTKINFEIYEVYQILRDYLNKTKSLKDLTS